jgi:hypothetical protein
MGLEIAAIAVLLDMLKRFGLSPGATMATDQRFKAPLPLLKCPPSSPATLDRTPKRAVGRVGTVGGGSIRSVKSTNNK